MSYIALSGQPRSGYALLNAVIHKIKLISGSIGDKKEQQKAQYLFRTTGTSLYNKYLCALKKNGYEDHQLIINGEFRTICGGPQWFDSHGDMYVRKYIGIVDVGDILITHKIPNTFKYFYDTIHSHESPTNLLNSCPPPFNSFATIRNPLGIFNSANHSINALSSEYLQKFHAGISQTSVREEMSICKFSDLKLCHGLLKHQTKYWDELLPVSSSFNLVKWEQLIKSPIETIRSIAEKIGVALSDSDAASIWSSMDHVNTMLYHKHNFRAQKGIVGDWKNNLINEHIDMFKEFGFDHILGQLGYPLLKYFDEAKYNAKQIAIRDNIRSGRVPQILDKNFATFCFNKSNIDTTAYNFYSGEWVDNTKIERATFTHASLFDDLVEATNQVTGSVFEMNSSDSFASQNFRTPLLHLLRDKLSRKEKIALWGISSDFYSLINALELKLSEHPNITLFDQIESGLTLADKTIMPSNQLKHFSGDIFALPMHEQAMNSMRRFAESEGFLDRLITNELEK